MTAVTVPPCLVYISHDGVNYCRFSENHGYKTIKTPCQVPGLHACASVLPGYRSAPALPGQDEGFVSESSDHRYLRIAPQFIPADAGNPT